MEDKEVPLHFVFALRLVFTLCFIFALYFVFALCFVFTTIPSHKRPAIRRPALEASVLGPGPAPALVPNNNLFQEFMWTCIKKVQDQALMAPNGKARKDALDRLLKPRNPDLYYGHLHIECYYFCQQCKDYFKIAKSLGHKRVLFATRFLKDHMLHQ